MSLNPLQYVFWTPGMKMPSYEKNSLKRTPVHNGHILWSRSVQVSAVYKFDCTKLSDFFSLTVCLLLLFAVLTLIWVGFFWVHFEERWEVEIIPTCIKLLRIMQKPWNLDF